jgi:hypothetical protein
MNATGINVQRMAQRANSKPLNIFGASGEQRRTAHYDMV